MILQTYKFTKQLFYVKTHRAFIALFGFVINLVVSVALPIDGTFSAVVAGIFLATFINEQMYKPIQDQYEKSIDEIIGRYKLMITNQTERIDKLHKELNERELPK
jgi:hypothetical protein